MTPPPDPAAIEAAIHAERLARGGFADGPARGGQPPSVRIGLECVGNSVEDLNRALMELIDRIGPVLRPDGPHDPRAVAKPDPIAKSDVASALDGLIERIRLMTRGVEDVIGRIDL